MSVSGGKYMALEQGKELKCKSIQIFVRNVRSWKSKPLEKEEIDKYLETREQLRDEIWPILSHNSYLINLATSDEEKLEKSHIAMLDELVKAHQLDIDYVVMHPGTPNKDDEKETKSTALARIASQLNSLLKEIENPTFKILLENTAGQGNNLGRTFEELKYIIDRIDDKDKIGVCFDTCHAFAAGYDFTTQEKYEQLWDEFDSIIGLKYLFAFHLNDSEKNLGSRIDRHIHIGQGKIGKKPFGFFVNDERFKDHPGILETPKGKTKEEDRRNLEILHSLEINK
ncbi:MAG: deoxyribonuclease IV [Promethearchaeota archaeon]